MPAEWHDPITWDVDQLVTNEDLNEQVRDNLEFLKDPPTDDYLLNESSNYTTTSTTFVDIDATNLALSIETAGGDVMVGFTGTIRQTSGGADQVFFDILYDPTASTPFGGDDGFVSEGNMRNDENRIVSFVALIRGVNAGTNIFKLQWKVTSGGTAFLCAGAGTSDRDVHPQFWVREVS